MRTIMFRGLTEQGNWIYGSLIRRENVDYIGGYEITAPTMSDPAGDTVWIEEKVIRESVGEFSGLSDKNEKNIYEGDILTPTVYKGGLGKNWVGFKCEVIFHKGMFCFKRNGVLIQSDKPLCNSLYLGDQSNNEYEIVGNKYQNPELIQE